MTAAIQRWESAGLTAEQLTAMKSVKFEVADLAAGYLGEAGPRIIRVDRSAAGNSWFIDPTPLDDVQFGDAKTFTRRYTDPASPPAGRIDLLTAILHELGHAARLPDLYAVTDRDSVMYGYLTKGERRVPLPARHVQPSYR